MAAISELLREDFKDAELAEVYGESFLDTYVATQIRVLREQSQMTQAELAALLGTSQTVISRVENINYSAWNIGTLKKLARAFKVRLHVSFETYGALIDDVQRFSRKSLERAPRDKDPVLYGALADLNATQDVVGSQAVQTYGALSLERGSTLSGERFRKQPRGTVRPPPR